MRLISKRTGVVIAAAGVIGLVGAGGAYAGAQVTSHQIKNQTIRSIDLGQNSVGSSELRGAGDSRGPAVHGYQIHQGAVRSFQIRNGAVHKSDLSAGAKAGMKGPKGETGADGADGVSGYGVHNAEVRWQAGSNETVKLCADGKVALGGGYSMSGTANGDTNGVHVDANEPVYSGGVATGWHVTGSAQGQVNVKTWVVCASLNQAAQ
ncbi:MAG: hypothetical protein ACRDQA_01375 [Nocardioidaceae bacterium]